ncbi:hypothetical protein LCM02_04775 [Lutimonas saemankumensis]|uniref:DUF6438 domain-containing protein n=1 Tax=Lutimonas saemankumensis TaxID=483016 RepID=UPI001CD57F73|nr:DUF6438 domain-containing protein [Lutimonas saemankumensis]MCA0931755.1 hypothetical protein [Lutimonas saemankumensis]
MTQFKKIYLERTSGYFGNGGIYKLFITSKGNVHLTQEFHFGYEKKMRKWKIHKEALNKLDEIIHKYGYFNLKEKEPTEGATDMAFCTSEIELEDGTKRKVEHYLGDNAWPKRLTTIENWIDRITGVDQYLEESDFF